MPCVCKYYIAGCRHLEHEYAAAARVRGDRGSVLQGRLGLFAISATYLKSPRLTGIYYPQLTEHWELDDSELAALHVDEPGALEPASSQSSDDEGSEDNFVADQEEVSFLPLEVCSY